MNRLWTHRFSSPLGRIQIASTTKGLALLALPGADEGRFEQRLDSQFADYGRESGGVLNARVERQIQEYFSGKRRRFELPLDLQAPPFHAKVLAEVARIPYGHTKTYGEIARAVRNPGASRAVGTANAKNNIPIVIPCHRVVASVGLGGYGGGLEMKRFLLRLESVIA